jgi:O-acetyl-ADP-ribose deacetylase (regulator of RNase III)
MWLHRVRRKEVLMIIRVTGDILRTTCPAIAHGVAPNDPYASGLASQLRERAPSLYKDFRHWCHVSHPKPGTMWVWSGAGEKGSVQVACLFTQDGGYQHGDKPGRARVEFVNHALRELRKWIIESHLEAIALPRLATGVGGLGWEVVEPLIVNHLSDLDTPVFLYEKYAPGVAADERVPGRRAHVKTSTTQGAAVLPK